MTETENTEIVEKTEEESPVEKKEKSLKGLGGWLIFVAFGLVVNITLMSSTVLDLVAVLQSEDFSSFESSFQYLVMFEIGLIALFVLFIAYVFFLFARSKRAFPLFFIAYIILGFLLLIVDSVAVNFVIPEIDIFDPATNKGLLQQALYACIWIPYMRISKRVQQTFVN